DGRGVVAAASYEARRFGVHSAQPIQQAKRLCPHAVFLRGSHDKYRSYSQKIYGIFKEFTPIVEMMSIDEAYLNLTGCDRLHGSHVIADAYGSTANRTTGSRAARTRPPMPTQKNPSRPAPIPPLTRTQPIARSWNAPFHTSPSPWHVDCATTRCSRAPLA